jgi:hypothetical protein
MKSAISLTLITCLLVSAPSASAAEDHGHFFFFVAPGDATSDARTVLPRIQVPVNATLVHVGGGGEGVLRCGLHRVAVIGLGSTEIVKLA